MKVSEITINTLKDYITGDNGKSLSSRTGPELVDFFNSFGANDVYDRSEGGLPNALSRTKYSLERLRNLNGMYRFKEIVESICDGRIVSDPNVVAGELREIIKHDGYTLEPNEIGVYKVAGGSIQDPVVIEAHFQDIRSQIIDSIKAARYTVWVAMAWFTDREIGNELWHKHKSGVNVRVVVNDDDLTRQHGLDFGLHGIEYVVVAPLSHWGKKLMHNKFCIIDLNLVIHGSYNWTGNAEYNNEGITITGSRKLAEEFSSQFIELLKQK